MSCEISLLSAEDCYEMQRSSPRCDASSCKNNDPGENFELKTKVMLHWKISMNIVLAERNRKRSQKAFTSRNV